MADQPKKCKDCRGWGKGLVSPTSSLCNHCKRIRAGEVNRPSGAFDVPTQQQADNPIVLASPELQELWIHRHYEKLTKPLSWMSLGGEKRETTSAMPLPEKMNFVQCKMMAEHYGLGAEKVQRQMCTCDPNSWRKWAIGCTCPIQDWIVYHQNY